MDQQIVWDVYIGLMRYAVPISAGILLLRCALPLLTFRRKAEIWGWLELPDGMQLPLRHWENVVGRGKGCDVVLPFPTVSRVHGVLIRYDDGSWMVSDADSRGGLLVNGEKGEAFALQSGDVIELGGVPIRFLTEETTPQLPVQTSRAYASAANLLLLTALQTSLCVAFLLQGVGFEVICAYLGLMVLQWLLLLGYVAIRRPTFEVETIAFFLCSMSMAILATAAPSQLIKQLLAIALGLLVFLVVGWTLRDLQRCAVVRYLASIVGITLLVITLLFGQQYYGAKNWLRIAGFTVQPSEFVKICFVYAGSATLDRLVRRRNLILLILYTMSLCGLLALMNDFGTALVFFGAFLMVAFLRSGSIGTIALSCIALAFAAMIGLHIAPHALQRLLTWRHIWEDPSGSGYQQTQALMCMAAGGLLGLGAGQGKLKHLFASDTDLVFATITEEWGLLVAIMTVLSIVVLALFCLRCAKYGRSSFFVIAASTATGIFLLQTICNVLGTVDVLPLTGVTFPFVSNGGSSMVCVWGLLAFVKAVDTRNGGSFAVKSEK